MRVNRDNYAIQLFFIKTSTGFLVLIYGKISNDVFVRKRCEIDNSFLAFSAKFTHFVRRHAVPLLGARAVYTYFIVFCVHCSVQGLSMLIL
jgi:hypothetical protein